MVVYKVSHVIILCKNVQTYIPYNNIGNLDGKHCLNSLMPAFNISEICAVSLGEK